MNDAPEDDNSAWLGLDELSHERAMPGAVRWRLRSRLSSVAGQDVSRPRPTSGSWVVVGLIAGLVVGVVALGSAVSRAAWPGRGSFAPFQAGSRPG